MELFVRNPVFGVGFRAHEFLLKADSSSHNGYLATLAEVGILGFLRGFCSWSCAGCAFLWTGSREPELGSAKAFCLDRELR